MPPLVRRDIWFDSADGKSKVAGYIYTHPYLVPFCVVQISHGMCEYMARYEELAAFLTQRGIAVCGNDHLGHGKTAADPRQCGHFTRRGGRRFLLADLKTMNEKIHGWFPGAPVVLLGHSMGSFLARKYVAKWPATVDGLVLSGTAGPNKAAGLGMALAGLFSVLFGSHRRSRLVHSMAFGQYLKQIPNHKTNYDWISRDEAVVAKYAADPLCTFRFTLNGFHELFGALRDVSGPQWAATVRKNMPILMIQGDADPVGDYGRGTATVRGWLRNAEVRNVEYITYPGARHEVLNETMREEVYVDVMAFISRWWGQRAEVLYSEAGPGKGMAAGTKQ